MSVSPADMGIPSRAPASQTGQLPVVEGGLFLLEAEANLWL